MGDPELSVRREPTRPGFIGRYRVIEEIGRGGMGVVLRAHDERLGRDVALKSVLSPHATDDDRRRVLREAQAASRVSHPHIVTIYEVFEDADRPWLAMELVQGVTLSGHLRQRGRLRIEEVLRLGEHLAEALATAHLHGVLHRDLKPSNIMVSTDGNARLMDFGLAQVVVAGDDSTITSLGPHPGAGTAGYMPPEQILGRVLSPPSDLFSLGTVLYEMATGRRAFAGRVAGDALDATLHAVPPAPGLVVRGLPIEFDRIVGKMLAKEPEERYQSARDVASDLRALRRTLELRGGVATQPAVRYQWALATAALALVAVGLGRWLGTSAPEQSAILRGTPRQLTAHPGWEAEPSLSPDGSLVAYASDQSGNTDVWLLDVHGGEALRLTAEASVDRNPVWFPDGSTLAFVSDRDGVRGIWRMPRLGGTPTPLVANAEDPAVSADGRRIAFARRDANGFYRIGTTTIGEPTSVRMVTAASDGLWDHRQPAWSPDGRNLVYAASRDLWMVPADGGVARRLTADNASDRDPIWSRDGTAIYFSSNRDGTRALWRVPLTGAPAVRITGGHGPERHPSWSSDGTRLVYSTYDENADLALRPLGGADETRLGGERIERSPVFTPDGGAVVFVSDRWAGRYDLWLQPLIGLKPAGEARRVTDQAGSVAQPAVSPDGRWITYHRVLAGQRDIWIAPIGGGPAHQLTDDRAEDVHPDWSPDGQSVVFVSARGGTDRIWTVPVREAQPAGPARPVTDRGIDPEAPTWSPDGAVIAFVGQAHTAREVYLAAVDGREPPRKLTTGASAWRLAWNRVTGQLWASGYWGTAVLSLRRVDLADGSTHPASPPLAMGADAASSDFDLSWDGQAVVFARNESRGDLWVYDVASPEHQ